MFPHHLYLTLESALEESRLVTSIDHCFQADNMCYNLMGRDKWQYSKARKELKHMGSYTGKSRIHQHFRMSLQTLSTNSQPNALHKSSGLQVFLRQSPTQWVSLEPVLCSRISRPNIWIYSMHEDCQRRRNYIISEIASNVWSFNIFILLNICD